MPARCAPSRGAIRERNPFPAFPGDVPVKGPLRKSAMGARRAWVLGAVQVGFVLHFLHWRLAGRTLSPVEPSEAMRTIELGEVNAGAVFFAATILSTMVLGRFFCGWGCHVVALQDLCGWLLRRLGIRPRPFRSRLLAWVPLLLALYMFVWPTAKRLVIAPLASRWLPSSALAAPAPPFPGFSNHLTTTDFWATFAPVGVAIPFLLVCGFAVVYLLGSKGFCTYGCPYGAFFATADRVAPGRIRVDDRCDGCAHCTAVCTSNVRVHEEVRRFGMVADPGCMKCLDCVSACPKDALSFGFGGSRARAVAGKPATRVFQDLSWPAEVALAICFLAAFAAWRGAYDAVPLLMAVGIALTATGLVWLTARLPFARDVALHGVALRRDGRLLWAGAGTVGAALAAALLSVQAGLHTANLRAAREADAGVTLGREAVLLDGAVAGGAERDRAEAAIAAYRRADGFGHGGLGLVGTREIALRRAWLELVAGRPERALAGMERALPDPSRADSRTRTDLALVRARAGQIEAAIAELRAVIAAEPTFVPAHRALARVLLRSGQAEAAAAALVVVTNLEPADARVRAELANLLERLGRREDAARYR